jgi:hypothetical protein
MAEAAASGFSSLVSAASLIAVAVKAALAATSGVRMVRPDDSDGCRSAIRRDIGEASATGSGAFSSVGVSG